MVLKSVSIPAHAATQRKLFAGRRMFHVQRTFVDVQSHRSWACKTRNKTNEPNATRCYGPHCPCQWPTLRTGIVQAENFELKRFNWEKPIVQEGRDFDFSSPLENISGYNRLSRTKRRQIFFFFFNIITISYPRDTVGVRWATGWWRAGSRRGKRYRSELFQNRRTPPPNNSTGTCTPTGPCHVWDTSERGPRRCNRRTLARLDRSPFRPRPARIGLRLRSTPVKRYDNNFILKSVAEFERLFLFGSYKEARFFFFISI